MIEYVSISIAKGDYQPEPRMIDGSDFTLKENNQCKGVSEILADYLIEEWNKDFIKRMEGYSNATTGSN